MSNTTQKQVLTPAIAAAYWGAKIKAINKPNYVSSSYHIRGRYVLIDDFPLSISHCQLILTPLPEVSEIHGMAIAKILNDNSDEGLFDLGIFNEWMEDILFNNCVAYSDYVSGIKFREVFDYCRANSIDVGYGSIPSLIQAGIAVSSKK